MLNIGNLNDNEVLTITAKGKLKEEDYNRVLPQLEQLLQEHEKLRFFIKLDDFQGFEPEALWKELKFDKKHRDEFGKTAVVGDRKWEELGTKLSDLFFRAEVRFFESEGSDKAWEWVNN